MDDFDRWMRRPVYVVHCYTCRIARSLSIFRRGSEAMFFFRAKPQYRRQSSLELRRATASKLWEMRRRGLLDRKLFHVKDEAARSDRGVAVAVDLEAMLGLTEK